MLSALFGGGGSSSGGGVGGYGGGTSGRRDYNNSSSSHRHSGGSSGSSGNSSGGIFGFFKSSKGKEPSSSSQTSFNNSSSSSSKRQNSSSYPDNPNAPISSIVRSLKKASPSPSPPPTTTKKSSSSSSKKLTKHQGPTTTSLATAILRPGIGGYASDQPQHSFAYKDDKHSFSRQNISLLASHPIFPKPTGFLYSVRSALSSTHSLGQSLYAPSPGPSKGDMSKRHGRSHSSSTAREGKSRRGSLTDSKANETVTNLNGASRGLSSIREEAGSQDYRESSSTRKDGSPKTMKKDLAKSKSKSSSKHHHRDPEEKEKRRKKKEKEKDRERDLARERERDRTKDKNKREKEKGKEKSKIKRGLSEPSPPAKLPFGERTPVDAPSRAPPAPPTPVTIDLRNEFNRTPLTTTSTSLKMEQSSLLHAVSIALSSDRVRKEILNQATVDSDNFRITLEQMEDGIKLRTVPSRMLDGPGLEDDLASEPESAGAITPKAARSLSGQPAIKVVQADVANVFPEASEPIDFLLPFGGLDDKFDSGYEIENDYSEDEFSESSSAQDSSRRGSKLFSAAGQRTSMYSKASMASSFMLPDPLTQQLPVLLSLVDNTVSAYETIIDNRGSFAVGVGGYKSVARRLLDRVDTLFIRQLGNDAASWGELLEVVGGRRKLPLLTHVNPDDEDDLMELLGDNLEKREIYDTCLEVPEILEPAMKGMARLYPNSAVPITREVTALFLTTFPQFRPILQAAAEARSDELELLKSKRFASFLEIDGIKTDEERELKECVKIDAGLDKALQELEHVSQRLRDVKAAVHIRKELIEKRIQAPPTEMFDRSNPPTMPLEVRDAIKEIHIQSWREEELENRAEADRAPLPISENMDDLDDTSSIVPDDSASQIYMPKPPTHRPPAVPETISEETRPPRTPSRPAPPPPEDPFKDPSPATMKFFRHARSPSPSAASVRSVSTMLSASGKKKRKHALVRVALADHMFSHGNGSGAEYSVGSRKSNGVLRHSSLRESEMTGSSSSAQSSMMRTGTPGQSSHTSESTSPSSGLKSSKGSHKKKPVIDRESGAATPTRRQKGVGGYGSSTPVNATNRTGTILLMKGDKDKEGKVERKSSKKKKEREHGSGDSGSADEKPKRSRSMRQLLS